MKRNEWRFRLAAIAAVGLFAAGEAAEPTLTATGDVIRLMRPDGTVAWEQKAAGPVRCVRYSGRQVWYSDGDVHRVDVVSRKDVTVLSGKDVGAFEVTNGKVVPGAAASAPEPQAVKSWQWPIGWREPSAAERARIDAIVDGAALVAPKRPRKVLLVSRSNGYTHDEALAYGELAFRRTAERRGAFAVDVVQDFAALADAKRLAGYDAVLLNNSTSASERGTPGITKALTDFVRAGKGIVLVHSSVDAFYDSEPMQEMSGGLLRGHPWMAGGTARMKLDEPAHPLVAMFKPVDGGLSFSDEIYQQTTPPYSRARNRVLVTLDPSDAKTRAAADLWKKQGRWLRDDDDWAVSWVRPYGAGRVFYTSFGHDRRAFLDPERFGHMLAGLQYALGDLACDDRPLAGLPLAEATVVYEDALVGDAVKRTRGKSAVDLLTNVLSKVTGRTIRAVPESQASAGLANVLYLGDTQAAREAGIDSSKLLNAEFRLKVAGDRAYLVGRTGVAASFAVTEFVQQFTDYRFLTIDGDDPYTVNPQAVATAMDLTRRPLFYDLRNSFWADRRKDDESAREDWFRRCRAFTCPAYDAKKNELESAYRVSARGGYCHTQFNYCPPAKYFKDHPEYYAVRPDGQRLAERYGCQLCFTHPDVFRIVCESLERFIEEDRRECPTNYPCIYDFTQMDSSPRMCRCANCQALVKRYDRKGGYRDGGDAGLQLWFVNRLARHVRAKYPDVRIRTFAYVSTEEVPRDIKPEPNVIIWLCDLYSRCDHTRPLTHPFNADRRRIFEDWGKLTSNIQVWDYTLYGGPWEGDYPEVFPDATAADVRFFKSLGIDSVYFENHHEGQPFYELNTYVMARLSFGPDRDVNELVDEWCRVYGRAAKPMRKAIDFLRKVIAESPPANVDVWHNRALPWRTAANWETFFSLVRPAYDLADTPAAKVRVASALASTCKNLAKLYKASPDKAARYAEVKRDYLRFAREALELHSARKADYERDRQAVENFMGLLDLEFRDLPDALKGVARKDLAFYDHRQITYLPHGSAVRTDDPASEVRKALKVKTVVGDAANGFSGEIRGHSFKPVRTSVKAPDDGRYHWYRFGEIEMPRMCELAFCQIVFPLKDAYVESDGLDVNPNRCELWLSVKLDGDEKSPSDGEGLFVDRLVLRRLGK